MNKKECWINVYRMNGRVWQGACFRTRNVMLLGTGIKLLYRIHVRLK